MTKKGFTLVELLGTIIIISLIGLITSVSVTTVIKRTKNSLYNTQLELIESAAKVWGVSNMNKLSENNACYYLTLWDLKNEGLLDRKIINSMSKDEISNDMKIRINSNVNEYGRKNVTYEVDVDVSECQYVMNLTTYAVEYINIDDSETLQLTIEYGQTLTVDLTNHNIEGLLVKINNEIISDYIYEDGFLTIENVIGNVIIENINLLDTIAWENLTYRDIFITNNLAPKINENSLNSTVGTYTTYAGSPSIVTDATIESANYIPPYYLLASGTTSQQITYNVNLQNQPLYVAYNIRVPEYTKGWCGLFVGNTFNGLQRTTADWEIYTSSISAKGAIYIGSGNSANATCHINNPVAVNQSIFTTVPSEEEWKNLFIQYNNILK